VRGRLVDNQEYNSKEYPGCGGKFVWKTCFDNGVMDTGINEMCVASGAALTHDVYRESSRTRSQCSGCASCSLAGGPASPGPARGPGASPCGGACKQWSAQQAATCSPRASPAGVGCCRAHRLRHLH